MIPHRVGENTNVIVTEVAKLLKVKMKPEDISSSYRLPERPSRNNNRKPSVNSHVPFVGRDIRNKIFSTRKLTRNFDLEKLTVEGAERLFMNENLTQQHKKAILAG